MKVYQRIVENKLQGKKQFALLIDPDKLCGEEEGSIASKAEEAGVDYLFVGGSLLTKDHLDTCIKTLKKFCKIPIVLFPGSTLQINNQADAILYLSLISGRNAEMLIGKHVESSPHIKSSQLEVLPTGYMLIESGRPTAVSYMSNSTPIPHDKTEIAICTALAGELLGLKLIFMDGGSGALNPISTEMIAAVNRHISVPLFVGGGIKTPEHAVANCKAGADVIVIGNAIETDKNLIYQMAKAIHSV
jgi:phosphoglycerol geranylgeranyltransferase